MSEGREEVVEIGEGVIDVDLEVVAQVVNLRGEQFVGVGGAVLGLYDGEGSGLIEISRASAREPVKPSPMTGSVRSKNSRANSTPPTAPN
ncbi:hypothetical protein [Streptomyces sp. NPDC002952]|uniref:hypothetical protein n=1 Tax=Streptomyces sp. NPDC002952 TaxID=3364673 RepID=UPI0036795955